jgi:uncharacterized protein YegP (UPF0339 family)
MQYQLFKGEDQLWYWRFFTNGNVIFRSTDGYVNRLDAVRAMDIARGSATAERIEQGADGNWFYMQ